TQPNGFSAGAGEPLQGPGIQQEVGPRLNLVPELQVRFRNEPGELFNPDGFETENIVAHPDVVGFSTIEKLKEFADDVFGRPRGVTVPVNGLGASIAFERTSAGGGDIEGKIPVVSKPDCAITFYVDQIPGRQRKCVEVAHHGPGWIPVNAAVFQEGYP